MLKTTLSVPLLHKNRSGSQAIPPPVQDNITTTSVTPLSAPSREETATRSTSAAFTATSCSHLCFQKGGFTTRSGPFLCGGDHLLEHGGVLQHVGEDDESDLRATDEDLFELRDATVASCHRDVDHLTVHVVLRLEEFPAVHLAGYRLDRDNVTLGLVQDLYWYSDRHFVVCVGFEWSEPGITVKKLFKDYFHRELAG